MVYVEIEGMGLVDGSLGCLVHHWDVVESEDGQIESMDYLGEGECYTWPHEETDDEDEIDAFLDEARKKTVAKLNRKYGKRGWQHI